MKNSRVRWGMKPNLLRATAAVSDKRPQRALRTTQDKANRKRRKREGTRRTRTSRRKKDKRRKGGGKTTKPIRGALHQRKREQNKEHTKNREKKTKKNKKKKTRRKKHALHPTSREFPAVLSPPCPPHGFPPCAPSLSIVHLRCPLRGVRDGCPSSLTTRTKQRRMRHADATTHAAEGTHRRQRRRSQENRAKRARDCRGKTCDPNGCPG
jgi:hypothetical protein